MVGIKTNVYKGSCTGIESCEINKQYLHFPELSNYPLKTQPLSIKKIEYAPLTGLSIILGQTTEIASQDMYRTALIDLIKIIHNQNQDSVILYKPHRWEKWNIKQILSNNKIVLVNDNDPIEEIVQKIRPENIYSFGSSALINIGMCLTKKCKSKVNIYAYPHLEYQVYKPLIPIFQKANVIIL